MLQPSIENSKSFSTLYLQLLTPNLLRKTFPHSYECCRKSGGVTPYPNSSIVACALFIKVMGFPFPIKLLTKTAGLYYTIISYQSVVVSVSTFSIPGFETTSAARPKSPGVLK